MSTTSQTSSSPPPAPTANAGERARTPESREPWRPRNAENDEEINGFANMHRSPDITPPPERIADAREDTAPLEGERDRSDDDSVVPEPPPARR